MVLVALVCQAAGVRHQLAIPGKNPLANLLIGGLLVGGVPVLAAILAVALAWRARAAREARMLALFLALLAYWAGAQNIWYLPGFENAAPLAEAGLNLLLLLAFWLSPAALLRFCALFPVPLSAAAIAEEPGPLRRLRQALLRPRVVWGVALVMALLQVPLVLAIVLPALRRYSQLVNTLGSPPTVAVVLAFFLAALLNLRTGYRLADRSGRRRIFWLLEGMLAGAAILVIASAVKVLLLLAGRTTFVGSWNWYPISIFASLLVILVGLAVAMFYSGALDPALAIRRTAVFGLVALTMVFVFAGVENAMQDLVAERLGMSAHLSGLISGGLVALTFDPIKERFSRLVEHWSGRAAKSRARELLAHSAGRESG